MKPITAWLAAAGAVAYLVLMAATGAVPQRGQYVKFEARGLLVEDPQFVDSVVLTRAGKTRIFTRSDTRWQENGQPLPAAAASILETAVKFMHTSAPVRTMSMEELKTQDPREFGLAPPQFTVRLTVRGASALDAGFGGVNPSGRLNYVGVIGRAELYLLSHFVVEEWEKVLSSPAP